MSVFSEPGEALVQYEVAVNFDHGPVNPDGAVAEPRVLESNSLK